MIRFAKANLKHSVGILALGVASAASAQSLTFMTGPQGGSWVPLGGAIKNMWEKAIPGLNITTTPGAGIANVRGVDEGKAQIGFGNSSTSFDGVLGNPPYPKKTTKVCEMAAIYPQYFQVVALKSANMKSLKDLKGKVMVTQPKGNTSELLNSQVLEANGMSYKDMKKVNFLAGYTGGVAMMKDGHADVFTLGTTAPASAVMDLASARDIDLVPMDDTTYQKLKQKNAGYTKLTIKAGTYPKQDKDVQVVGYATHVIVSCDLPEDMVYTMTKTLATNLKDLASIVKAIAPVQPKDLATDLGVPFHKGALKYYKEIGAL